MVFYIIAATKENLSDDQVQQQLQQQAFADNRPTASKLHPYYIAKQDFKVGTLDILMTLNEHCVKVDQTLSTACNRTEKIAFDTGSQNLMYINNEEVEIEYKNYITTFQWNNFKYSQGHSLKELIEIIQKTQKTNEDIIKHRQEEYKSIRDQLQSFSKKEGGNYLTKDFSDDIYSKADIDAGVFVDSYGSEMFANLLFVVPKAKRETFKAEMEGMMEEYYSSLKENELKKAKDHASIRAKKLLEGNDEAKKQMQDLLNLAPEFLNKPEYANEDMNDPARKVELVLLEQIKKEIQDKYKNKIPGVVVPGSSRYLGLEDKDQNQIHRIVVYKDNADDVVKALRRKGYVSKIFSYNKAKWEKDEKTRGELAEKLENAQRSLNGVAITGFQELFTALMHLKIIRAYIDGVLRFGIPAKFYLGLVVPGKGQEKKVLKDMTNVLADQSMLEMYGERIDSNETDDYWPFVCINLNQPTFIH